MGFLHNVFALVVLLALAPSVCAADRFIVRAPRNYVNELAGKFGLTVLKQITGHEIFLVQGPEGVPAEQVIANLHNYDHGKDPDMDDDDDDDVQVELDAAVSLAETAPGVPRLITSTAPVAAALRNKSNVNLGEVSAWSGYARQPALSKIRLPEAHSRFGTGAGIVVAVIDTGIDPDHPVLRGSLAPGYDFVRDVPGAPSELDDLDPETRSILSPYTTAILDWAGEANPYTTAILDQQQAVRLNPGRLPVHFGHGTMVAGLVRVAAPGARIMPLKPFGVDGKARLFHILQCIYYGVDNGAKVLNLSLSMPAPSLELQRAAEYASRNGAILVASGGNHGQEIMTYPAGFKEVIGVGSTNLNDVQSRFSNYGDNLITIAAPGEALITLYPGGRYAAGWGTSFSAPLVAGAVALMARVKSSLNWELAEAGVKEAEPVNGDLGNGRINAYRAAKKASEF